MYGPITSTVLFGRPTNVPLIEPVPLVARVNMSPAAADRMFRFSVAPFRSSDAPLVRTKMSERDGEATSTLSVAPARVVAPTAVVNEPMAPAPAGLKVPPVATTARAVPLPLSVPPVMIVVPALTVIPPVPLRRSPGWSRCRRSRSP